MSSNILILGESGAGKSASLRNMDPAKTLLIQALRKPLPFRNDWTEHTADNPGGNVFVTDRSTDIALLMQGTKRKIIILDDFQYVLANEFMRRSDERGYDKFSEIGRHAWDILCMSGSLSGDVRVYILGHSDTGDDGRIRTKTIGKMLNEKITVEGMFTIVMRCIARDGEYLFTTKTNGFDPVKTPIGLFESDLIPNDLAEVDRKICEFYKIS